MRRCLDLLNIAFLCALALTLSAGCKSDPSADKPKPKPSPVEPATTGDSPDKTDETAKPVDTGEQASTTSKLELPNHKTFASVEFAVEFLDPNLIAESSGTRIGKQLFEQLVTIEPGNPKPIGAQATSWKVSDDGKTYNFELRKEARWSDGKKLTSADWMYSFERALNPKTGSRNAQQMWIIKGARAYNKGDSTDFSTVAVTAPSEYQLQFELMAPAPYFIHMLTYIAFSPVPKHVIDAHGKKWTRAENMVSNGAFKMKLWKVGERVEVVKNPEYWDKDTVWLDGITWYMTNSDHAAHDWYEQGKVHWTPGVVPLDKVKAMLRSGRPDFHIDPILCTYYYVINVEKPPMDDVRVRHAFNMALDKGKLVRQVMQGGQKAASHLVPPHFEASTGYGKVRGDAFNPEKARALLKEAGYGEGGKPFPEVTVIYNTSEGHKRIAEFFQRSIKTNLGIEVQINNMEWKTLLASAHSGEFQIARTSWCADFPDPENFVNVFDSQGENNYSNYKNEEFDATLRALRSTGDNAERNKLTAKAEGLLNTDVPLIPFYFYTRAYMKKEWVRGLLPEINDRHNFKYLWFGPPGAKKP